MHGARLARRGEERGGEPGGIFLRTRNLKDSRGLLMGKTRDLDSARLTFLRAFYARTHVASPPVYND